MNVLNRIKSVGSRSVICRVVHCSTQSVCQPAMTCVRFREIEGKVSLYPTHHCFIRGFRSGRTSLNSKENEDKTEEKGSSLPFDKTPRDLSYKYSFKVVYYMFFYDKALRYHLGPSFTDGAKLAFLYITECLAEKNFEGLSDVVTHELLDRVKDKGMVYPEVAKKVFFMKLMDINMENDTFNKTKELYVDVKFAYSTSDSEKQSLADLKFALFRFHRTYGENMKDSNWIVVDFQYLTRFLQYVTLKRKK